MTAMTSPGWTCSWTSYGQVTNRLRTGDGQSLQRRYRSRCDVSLHEYLGNPVLSGVGRLFFSSAIRDFHCGMRGFRKDSIGRLQLRTTGMEFASEWS